MTPAALWCALAAGGCVAVLCGPGPRRLVRTRLPGAGTVATSAPVDGRRLSRAGRTLLPAAGCGVLLLVFGPSGVLLAATAALLVAAGVWLHASARRRRAGERGRRETIEACDALSAEMRAGQAAARALHRAAEQHPALWPAARACLLGGDVPAALRRHADTAGCSGMATVAAAWQVAEGSGSGLVGALERVAESLRADDATRAEVTAALSPARATARLLAVLPAFGLLLGSGLGGDPLGLLLRTPAGNGLLLAGVGLALAGTVWVERLALRVES